MLRRLVIVGVALTATVLGVFGVRALWQVSVVPTTESTVSEAGLAEYALAARSCARDVSPGECMNAAVQRLAPRFGVATSLAGMEDAAKAFPVYGDTCHRSHHYLGEFAGETYPDVDSALAAGDDRCQYGYFHGVMEGYARVTPNLWEELSGLCYKLSPDPKSYVHQECSHSMGHAVVTRTDNVIDAGLSKCELLRTSDEYFACATGIFMSWSHELGKRLNDGQPIDGKWLWAPADARWTGCARYESVTAAACVLYFAETAEYSLAGLGEFRSWCVAQFADPLVVEQCHRGVGRVAGGNTGFAALGGWENVHELCRGAQEAAAVESCLQASYLTASGFQPPSMVADVCRAWEKELTGSELSPCQLAADTYRAQHGDPTLPLPGYDDVALS